MKLNVGVFFGGVSVEHEISVISALQAIHALNREKYEAIPVYISKEGVMYTGSELTQVDNYKDLPTLLNKSTPVSIARMNDGVYLIDINFKRFGLPKKTKIDIAFPIVHGTNCEDGSIQGLFESLRIPYVGCDVLSSAIGMDKDIMKQVLRQNNIPVVDFVTITSRQWASDSKEIIDRVEGEIGYPVIVKPANLGSSVGIKKASNREEFIEAVELASSFAIKVIIERAVNNLKEINCSVVGDYSSAAPSALEEPIQSDEILSYQDKYLNKSGAKGMSSQKRKLPAELSAEKEREIKELAVKTFKALGASGVSRIDFLLDMADGEKVYVNEINTIPGSLSFYLWEAAGKPFGTLLDELIDLAFKRERERGNLMFTYSSNIFAMGGGFSGKK